MYIDRLGGWEGTGLQSKIYSGKIGFLQFFFIIMIGDLIRIGYMILYVKGLHKIAKKKS